ncbi:hypothetical protein D3C73_891620 [compost metagenome]
MQLRRFGQQHPVDLEQYLAGQDAQLLRRAVRQYGQHFAADGRMHEAGTGAALFERAVPAEAFVQEQREQRCEQRQRAPPGGQQADAEQDYAVRQEPAGCTGRFARRQQALGHLAEADDDRQGHQAKPAAQQRLPWQISASRGGGNQQEQRQRPERLQLIAADDLAALTFEEEWRGEPRPLPAGEQRFRQMEQRGQHQQLRNIHLPQRCYQRAGHAVLQRIREEINDKLYDSEQAYGIGKA